MTDLTTIFKNHKAFIAFVVAGDPNFEATVDQVVALAEAGCDLVEIGIPFSDPVADGPKFRPLISVRLTNTSHPNAF